MHIGAYPAEARLGGHEVEIVSIFAGALGGTGDRATVCVLAGLSLRVRVCRAPSMGAKGAWYVEMANVLPTKYPHITALVAFDTHKEEDWRVDSSAQALAGLRRAVDMLGSTKPVG